MLKQLLEHCNGLTLNNNKYTKVYNDHHNNDLIDKKTWVFCTKYAELLMKENEHLIIDFLNKYRKIDKTKITISDIDYSYSKTGDNGDLYYFLNKTPYIIHVKSCPNELYENIKKKLKHQNSMSFMGIASIVIRPDIIPLKNQLHDLWNNNVNDFINYVIKLYDNCEIRISDLQFINQITTKVNATK